LFLNASEWLYYKHYPWVYDNKSKDWLYLRGSDDGKIYAYRASSKAWEEFGKGEPTWEEQYEEWVKKPDPYGGLDVLWRIKEAKDSGATSLDLTRNNITDLTPLAGLTNLVALELNINNITDLTPLAGMANLSILNVFGNNISNISPLARLTNLRSLLLYENPISDLTPLAGLTNLEEVYLYELVTAQQKSMWKAALPNADIY
jgi:Leucine-rich repeat (LRR) protein